MWIDSHAHLFDYSTEALEKVIEEASVSSVSTIISTATNLNNSLTVVKQCENFKSLFGVVGISPFDVDNQPDNYLDEISTLVKKNGIIGIGEIGIDKTNPRYPSFEKQLSFFIQQLELAKSINVPIIIHSRGAEQEALDICLSHGIEKAVFHCFTGSLSAAQKIISSGYMISLSGILTFKNAGVRDIAQYLPLNQLLIETDSPYLAPVPYRGHLNRPALVKFVGEELARLKNLESDFLQHQLEDNFNRLFFNKIED